jgi:hypothetical protein
MVDPQEHQKQKRELKLEQDRQDRDHKKALRAGIAAAHEGIETSITPPVQANIRSSPQEVRSVDSSPQPSIPDHAIEVSLGASVLVTHTPTYTRRGILINQPVEIPGTQADDAVDADSKPDSI